jgi:hypothetical protein
MAGFKVLAHIDSFAPAKAGALAYDPTNNKVYALAGHLGNAFYTYTVTNNTWNYPASAPWTVYGGGLVYYSSNSKLYALRGDTSKTFSSYTIANVTWTALASPPTFIYGGSLTLNTSNSKLYAVQGKNGTGFYSYTITANTWATLATVPADTLFGSVTYNSTNGKLYVFRANTTGAFYSYTVSGNSFTTLTATGFNCSSGALTYDAISNVIYLIANSTSGSTTGVLAIYTISANTWTRSHTPDVPGFMGIPAVVAPPAKAVIYILPGNPSYTTFWEYSPNAAPAAPNLQTPSNGAYVTAASGVTFKSQYVSTDAEPANAYAIRYRLSSATTYKYWNGTGTQSTVYWNATTVTTGHSQSVTLPNTQVSNGHTYVWSMAYRESGATLTGPFATNFTFSGQAPPTLTVTAPTGTVTVGRPVVTWTATPTSGTSIIKFRVKLFTAAQYGAGGFVPGTSTATWDSGTISGSTSSKTIGATLVNGTSYRAYVRVAETGTEFSTWEYTSFTADLTAPIPPSVTATATTVSSGYPVIQLSIQCHDNLLTATTATGKGGVGLWADTTDCTVTVGVPPVAAVTGPTKAISLKATASATMIAKMGTPASHVVGGATYTVQGQFLANTGATVKSCHLTYTWYKSTGATISSGTTPVVTDSTSAWTKSLSHVTAPATAAKVSLKATVASAVVTQIHWLGAVGVFPGTITTWGQGGFVGNTKLIITRRWPTTATVVWYLRGASTLNRKTVPTTQKLTLDDYECVPSTEYHYTVKEVVTATTVGSPLGTSNTAKITPSGKGWWMVMCVKTTTVCNAQPITFKPQVTEQSTAHLVLGQATPNIVSSTMGGQDGTATFETFTKTNYADLQNLLQSQQVIFMQNPFATPYTPTYVRFGPQSGGMSSGYGNKIKTGKLSPSTATAPHHNTSVTWVAQPRPPV